MSHPFGITNPDPVALFAETELYFTTWSEVEAYATLKGFSESKSDEKNKVSYK